jgi:DNA-directed RNA polymerase subunit M/transcription elongation factor TFIIS
MSQVREKVQQILREKCNVDEPTSKQIEKAIYNWAINFAIKNNIVRNWECTGFMNIYTDKARSITDNLDKNSYIKNNRLRDRLDDGEFLARELPFLPNDIIFPERWEEAINKKIKREEGAYEDKIEANTTAFRCGKCGGRECFYREKQIHSADEPMTVFLQCLNRSCGNRWRIG